MKNTLRGFYSLKSTELNKEIWNSEKTLFIFDTNCLLNLYRCEDKTREDIFSVMSQVKDKIWLPFFVCLEFQKNRRDVISESIDSLTSISKALRTISDDVNDSLSKGRIKKQLYTSLSESVQELQKKLSPLIDEFINVNITPRIESKKKIEQEDIIRDEIDSLIKDSCGKPPTQDWINSINTLGADRYAKQLPPGFKDEKKTGRKFFLNLVFEEKYGDLYIWNEILEKANTKDVENVIFICDDNKNDWWYERKGITHGALEYLQTEIYSKSTINYFKLLNQSSFLQEAQKFLPNVSIDSKSAKELEDILESRQSTNEHINYNASYNDLVNIKFNKHQFSGLAPSKDDFMNEKGYDLTPANLEKITHYTDRLATVIVKLEEITDNNNYIFSEMPVTIAMHMAMILELLAKLKSTFRNLMKHVTVLNQSNEDYIFVKSSFLSSVERDVNEGECCLDFCNNALRSDK